MLADISHWYSGNIPEPSSCPYTLLYLLITINYYVTTLSLHEKNVSSILLWLQSPKLSQISIKHFESFLVELIQMLFCFTLKRVNTQVMSPNHLSMQLLLLFELSRINILTLKLPKFCCNSEDKHLHVCPELMLTFCDLSNYEEQKPATYSYTLCQEKGSLAWLCTEQQIHSLLQCQDQNLTTTWRKHFKVL